MQTHRFDPSRLKEFISCRNGANILEFALALPAFVFLLAGILEITMIMFVSILAEGGLREASRYGITGQVPAGVTREEQLVQIVQEHTHGLIDVTAQNVTFKVYGDYEYINAEEPYIDANDNGQYDDGEEFTDWNSNATWDSDTGEDGVGGAGDIVLYEVSFKWDFMTPLFSKFGGDDGALDLSASIAVRNEPYDAAGDAT
ncbi:MAG: pilus assembly protein [Kiloniellales bacterium]|nr:pilus assembly protein [Kiloniellales bacterium]